MLSTVLVQCFSVSKSTSLFICIFQCQRQYCVFKYIQFIFKFLLFFIVYRFYLYLVWMIIIYTKHMKSYTKSMKGNHCNKNMQPQNIPHKNDRASFNRLHIKWWSMNDTTYTELSDPGHIVFNMFQNRIIQSIIYRIK